MTEGESTKNLKETVKDIKEELNLNDEDEDEVDEFIEKELTCVICFELMIEAVALPCDHVYCKDCIYSWKKTRSTCPVCHKRMYNPSIRPIKVVDSIIERLVSRMNDEDQQSRRKIVNERLTRRS